MDLHQEQSRKGATEDQMRTLPDYLRKPIEMVKGLTVRNEEEFREIWNNDLFEYWFQVDVWCFQGILSHETTFPPFTQFGHVAGECYDYMTGPDWDEEAYVAFAVFHEEDPPERVGWTGTVYPMHDWMTKPEGIEFVVWMEAVTDFCTKWEENINAITVDDMVEYLSNVNFSSLDEASIEAIYKIVQEQLEGEQ